MKRKILLAMSLSAVVLATVMKPFTASAQDCEVKLKTAWEDDGVRSSDLGLSAAVGQMDHEDSVLNSSASIPVFTSEEEVVEHLREQMVLRKNKVPVVLKTKNQYTDGSAFLKMYYDAQEETGVSDEGDYLRFHMERMDSPMIHVEYMDGIYTYQMEFRFSYYSDLEEEQAVTAEVTRILEELKVSGMKSDYQKIRAIHQYLAEHITYDYKDLNDSSNVLKFTAYDALIEHTSVCQGYASSMYRLMMEAGIPTRIVVGTSRNQNHAWNIVKLNGKWYYMDSTWESGSLSSSGGTKYMLRGSRDFKEHSVKKDSYYTDAFYASYPVAVNDYKVTEKDKYDVADLQVSLSKTAFTYNGKALKPKIQVKGMKEGIDYTVKYTYKNHVEPGTAVVTAKITGKGICKGTRTYTAKYTIALGKPTAALSSISGGCQVSWKKITGAEGYQVQYGTSSDFSKASTKKLNGSQTVSCKVTGLKKGKTYYVRVRAYRKVAEKTCYSEWSAVKKKKI